MNKQKLQAVHDLIESLPEHRVDMRYIFGRNGEELPSERETLKLLAEDETTSADIIGWTLYLFEDNKTLFYETGSYILELTNEQASTLFFPNGWEIGDLTKADVLTALHSVIHTGRAWWPDRAAPK